VEMQVLVDRVRVNLTRDAIDFEQRFDLAGKRDPIAVVVEVDLLDAERIARKYQPPGGRIPEPESEYAGRFRETARTVLAEQVQERFGIGRPAKAHALVDKARPEILVVVELAVVGDDARSIVGHHRLMAG